MRINIDVLCAQSCWISTRIGVVRVVSRLRFLRLWLSARIISAAAAAADHWRRGHEDALASAINYQVELNRRKMRPGCSVLSTKAKKGASSTYTRILEWHSSSSSRYSFQPTDIAAQVFEIWWGSSARRGSISALSLPAFNLRAFSHSIFSQAYPNCDSLYCIYVENGCSICSSMRPACLMWYLHCVVIGTLTVHAEYLSSSEPVAVAVHRVCSDSARRRMSCRTCVD